MTDQNKQGKTENKKTQAVDSTSHSSAWKSKWSLPTLVLAVTIVSFGLFYAVGSNRAQAPAVSEACAGTCVALKSSGADPREITVTAGSYVQFNSADGKTHSLSLGQGGEEHEHSGPFSSGDFGADEAWRVQFKEDGSYIFHDHYNPDINVLVVVYTPGKDYKIQ